MLRFTQSFRLPILLLAAVLAVFAACGEEEPEIPGLPESGTLTAKIDGDDWDATVVVQASTASGVLSVMGSNFTGQAINLTVQGYTGPGTYQLGGLGNTNQGLWVETLSSEGGFSSFGAAANSGEVVVSSDDGENVIGTFSFSGRNSEDNYRNVTDGSFNAPIQ